MGRISRTFELAGSSWRVLKADKELLILPFLSLLATLGVAYTFLRPMFDRCVADSTGGACELATGEYVIMFVMYVVLAFVTIFFNAALVHAANERMSGGDPGVGSALRGALLKVHRILPWALLVATVGFLLRAIQERAGALGRIVGTIAGVAWSLVTFLVVPVLVVEDVGVGQALKRSGAMFRKTWGENVAAQVGFGLVGFLLVLPALPVIGYGFAQGGTTAVILVAVGVGWIILASLVIAALNGIFQTALYRHATGAESSAFASGTLAGAFAPRGRGLGGAMPPGFAG